MNAFVIARHHLLRIVRSPGLIVILLAIPLTLATIEYAAFGPTVASGRLPPIKVLVLDEDRTFASRAVPQIFTAGGPLKDMFEVSAVDGRAAATDAFRRSEASALVIVPAGFQEALLENGRAELQYAPNPLQTFSPQIARSVLDMATLLGNGLYEQAAAPLRRINALRNARQPPSSDDVAEISREFYEAARRLNGLGAATNVSVTTVRPPGQSAPMGMDARTFFALVFPGLVIFGVMFISQSLALRLLRDKVRGVERRLGMTPVSVGERIAGSFLFMLCGLLATLALLMIVGIILFRIPLRNPAAIAVLALGFAVFAAALQLTIVAVAKDERSASFIGSAVIVILSLVGGTFIPAEDYPRFLRALAYAAPNGAAQQGFIDALAHARSFAQVSGRMATTWVWAAAATAIAVVAVRRASREA